nr:hypothetical protein [Kaustia mangrovi]
MGASHITELRRRTAVALSGPEARAFLQRILTSDIDAVSQDRAAYAALLTPQGKILFDMFVAQAGDRFLVDCAASQKDELVKRLTFYKLRAQVDIEDMGSDHAVAAIWGDDAQPDPGAAAGELGLYAFADPRTPEAGLRVVAPRASLDRLAGLFGAEPADELSYDRHRIALGLGDSDADIGSGRTFPTRPIWTSSAGSISPRAAMSARRSSRACSIAARHASASCLCVSTGHRRRRAPKSWRTARASAPCCRAWRAWGSRSCGSTGWRSPSRTAQP